MSVTTDDVTGEVTSSGLMPVEDVAKFDHLVIDVQTTAATESADGLVPALAEDTETFHTATIALNAQDVLGLGTETIAGIEALVIHGEQGDVIQLANEAGYAWARAEMTDLPEGYDAYQAHVDLDAVSLSEGRAPDTDDMPIYVLVQHDLTVVIATT